MNLIYTGIHDSVVVALPLGGEAVVKRGERLSTSDEHALRLLEQPRNWMLPEPKKSKTSKTKTQINSKEENN